MVKILYKYHWENNFSKVADCRRTVGGWTPSDIFFKDFDCKSATYFVEYLFFGQLFEEQHIFPVFRQKYFWWNYVHLWIKVWEKLLFNWKTKFLMKKANFTVKVRIYQITKWSLSLPSESLRNIHQRSLALCWSQNQSPVGVQ